MKKILFSTLTLAIVTGTAIAGHSMHHYGGNKSGSTHQSHKEHTATAHKNDTHHKGAHSSKKANAPNHNSHAKNSGDHHHTAKPTHDSRSFGHKKGNMHHKGTGHDK